MQDSELMLDDADCVELVLACADICQSIIKTIGQLTTWVEMAGDIRNDLLTELQS